MRRCVLILGLIAILACGASPLAAADEAPTIIQTPLSPPAWALLERELLRANTDACREFFDRYFDERGYLRCVERWGGDDGPDDAIENCTDWPILHALGAPDMILQLYKKAWEGHLRQYTAAKTVQVPFARDGMYYKEFPVMFDWLHNAEGLTVFNLQGLSDPYDRLFQQRARRYAGFYLNEDPGAPNYDPKIKIIRSMFNGSRGPLLRKATALDWAGDPIEVEHRFRLGHGERHYQEMLDHFKDYTDIIGDHPQNLQATTLAMNAYMLGHDEKYKRWLLEYVDAWRERMIANGNIIPTNIGLDGTIGGASAGKWYGGVYGWAFSVKVPQTGALAHRNRHWAGFQGFMNAYVLTRDDRYLEPWRKQIDLVNAQQKTIDGKLMVPSMYGDQGWYAYLPERYTKNTRELYYLSMKPEDRRRVPADGWLGYLDGKNPDYPETALRRDLDRVRRQVEAFRQDPTTPDTRLADDPLKYAPASVNSLIELMMGGLPPGKSGSILNCRLRYFDPAKRRAGIPEDVTALVDSLSDDQAALTLVNLNQLEPRTVVIQAGGYGEHRFGKVVCADQTRPVDATHFTVRLAPGAGSRLVLHMQRYVNPPTMAFPWDRGWAVQQPAR
jgi:hypothetical protein